MNAAKTWSYDRHLFIGQANYMNTMNDSFTQMVYAESVGPRDWSTTPIGLRTIPTRTAVPSSRTSTGIRLLPTRSTIDPPRYRRCPGEIRSWRPKARSTVGLSTRSRNTDRRCHRGGCGLDPVQTDGNGYYVVTLIPSFGAGWFYDVRRRRRGTRSRPRQTSWSCRET